MKNLDIKELVKHMDGDISGRFVVNIDDKENQAQCTAKNGIGFLVCVLSYVWQLMNEMGLDYDTSERIIKLGCVKYVMDAREEDGEGIEDILDKMDLNDPLESTIECIKKDLDSEAKKAKNNREKAESTKRKIDVDDEDDQLIKELTEFLEEKGFKLGKAIKVEKKGK